MVESDLDHEIINISLESDEDLSDSKSNLLPRSRSKQSKVSFKDVKENSTKSRSSVKPSSDVGVIKFGTENSFREKPFMRLNSSKCYDQIIQKNGNNKGKLNWETIQTGWDVGDPEMIINIIGDIKNSDDCNALKTAVINLFRMTKNTWIFNTGYANKFSEIVGKAVREVEDENYIWKLFDDIS